MWGNKGPRRGPPRGLTSLIAAALWAATGAAGGQEAAATLTPARIAAVAIPSVVMIRTPLGVGSGFAAGTGGKIVTNFHVIAGAAKATIVTSDHAEYTDVEVIAADPESDLAVLRVKGAARLTPLALGDSRSPKPGDHVVAIGNPLGLGETVSDGLLSAIRELPKLTLLQISAPISPGSSGGPVFNDHGEVIGVSSLVLNGGQNLNFAIPINQVKPMLAGEKSAPLKAALAPAPQRHIPDYSLSLLDDCPAPRLKRVVDAIEQGIRVGAPLYNQGNYEACYRIYEGVALDVQRNVQQCPGPKRALADGVTRAEAVTSWSDKAWAMRDAFDGVVAVVVKSLGRGTPGIERHVPDVPVSVIEQCPAGDVRDVEGAIASAIDSGAPLYNSGNIEACYRIYAGAIADIDGKFTRCPAARQVLVDGLHNADHATGWAAKAWALRDAFDGLTDAIARHEGGGK